jgi:hypothetical protein
MEQKDMIKQMIDFNSAVYNDSFNNMVTFQEQMGKAATTMIDQAVWLPEEGKNAIRGWIEAYNEGRDKFKIAMDEQMKKVETLFNTAS